MFNPKFLQIQGFRTSGHSYIPSFLFPNISYLAKTLYNLILLSIRSFSFSNIIFGK